MNTEQKQPYYNASINRNDQMCAGHRGTLGADHGQVWYRMVCMRAACGSTYGANGTVLAPTEY